MTAVRAGESHVLSRSLRWWHLAFGGVPLVGLLLALVFASPGSSLALALAGVAAYPLLWFTFGWRSFDDRRIGLGFTALLLAATAAAILAEPNLAVLQTLLFPFVWSRSDSTREAILLNFAVAVVVMLALIPAYGPLPAALLPAAAIAAISLTFSIAFGSWISRIAHWGEERARLLDDLTAAQDGLASAHREHGVATERERLARELHDTLTQSLTGLVMAAERAQRSARGGDPEATLTDLALIEDTARHALGEARAMLASSASVRVEGGLRVATERLAARFQRETGVLVDTRVHADLPRELEVVLLRCAQEGLANIRKHSAASSASLAIEETAAAVTLTVEDDGRGLPEENAAANSGFGVAGMRERVGLVGGTVALGARPGGGTRLTVIVPLEETP
ncbi:MAG: sensor histidine kinase [Naasia sp.]|jgi:signal transduction histidine kinase|uniref:sensor histidine kinase n=1 Tax=Naasia sp. TaxID=2546198 RepID=UPI0026307ABD|nr:histidine kinase [Naasia sp.]MCU1570675.1 sensor histidine kinase [Naasia sp.]